MGSGAWRMTIVEEEEEEIRKGPWTLEEDTKLIAYVRLHGAARWSSLAKIAGLKRNGKSCRMRWLNYLCPELKHGTITPEEERLIIRLHNKWGNKWSRIAQNLPGRTDNEIKNHWRTHIKKISPELIRSCSWRRASKSPEQIMAVRENNEPSSSESFEDQQMASMMECCAESNSSNTLNQVGCDICELHDGYQASLTSPEMHQEFIEISSDMDTLSSIIVDAYEAGMGQHSPSSSWSSVTDSPMNVFSDSEEFLWDYNSIDLWKLDDDVQNMHW